MPSVHKENGGLLDYATAASDNTGYGTYKKPNLSSSEKLDNVQLGLDGLGMAPGVGLPADLANAGISGARGNFKEMLFNLAQAIPGIGLGAGGLKISKNIAKVGKNSIKSGTNVVESFPNKRFLDWESKDARDVVTVKLKDANGKTFVQPFYKSSGTSGQLASHRKGVWEPFGGRKESGWYRKGGHDDADKFKFLSERYLKPANQRYGLPETSLEKYNMNAFKADANLSGFSAPKITRGMSDDAKYQAFDASARRGRYADVSDEITRLEEMGYYKPKGYKKYKNPKELNTLLEGEGFKLF